MKLFALPDQVRLTSPNTLKQRLAGGALCVLVLAGIYVCEVFVPSSQESLVSSILSMVCRTILFSMALCWTYRESDTPLLMGRLINLQVVAALIWVVANQLYPVPLPDAAGQVESEMDEVLLRLLAVAVCGSILFVSIRRVIKTGRQKCPLECGKTEKDSVEVLPEQLDFVFGNMMDGHKISSELASLETPLAKYCCTIDQPLSNWLEGNVNRSLTSREILICFLIRHGKTSAEIQKILALSDETYRKAKSRIAKKTGIKLDNVGGKLEQFLRSLH